MASGLVLLLALASWVPHLPSSLWLDETLTFWVVKNGLADAVDRALTYQPQPAYYVFMWLWVQLAGASEVALRIPSLLAMLGACVAQARLGTSLTGDRETGLFAAVVLAASYNAFRESVDARSYALGLLALAGCALALQRWLAGGRWRDAWLCGGLGALLPHLHVFFALPLPVFALYAAMRWPGGRRGGAQAGIVVLLLAVGALLYLPVARALLAHGSAYGFVPVPSARTFLSILIWPPPLAALFVGFLAAGLLGLRTPDAGGAGATPPPSAPPVAPHTALWLACWVLLPLVALYAVSTLTGLSVFLPRYLIPAIPALAILYALLLRRAGPPRARIAAAVALVIAALAYNDRPEDDFRAAAAAVRAFTAGDASVPVLLSSGMIEAQDGAWLRDPEHADYLTAPAAYYPLGERVIPAPRRLPLQRAALEELEPTLRDAERFAVVEWSVNGANVLRWLAPRIESAGYRAVRREFGSVRVALFEREPANR